MKREEMHIEFSRSGEKLKIFDRNHELVFSCEARNRTVNPGEDHWGQCPLGNYGIGTPETIDPPERAYGYYFTPLIDTNGLWKFHHRAGIGVHGGGSDLADPFADRQGWEETLGCVRLANIDNKAFIGHVQASQTNQEPITFSVVA
jgi:hypothetical protein